MRMTAIQFRWMKLKQTLEGNRGKKQVTFDPTRDQMNDLPPEDQRNPWMFEALDRART